MTLQQMKDKASLSELALIDWLELAIRPTLAEEMMCAMEDELNPFAERLWRFQKEGFGHTTVIDLRDVCKKVRAKMLAEPVQILQVKP